MKDATKPGLNFRKFFLIAITLCVGGIVIKIYDPPPLTQSKRSAYLKTSKFIDSHPRFGKIKIYNFNTIVWNKRAFSLEGRFSIGELMNLGVPLNEINQMQVLCYELEESGCQRAEAYGDMILFFPKNYFFIPRPPVVLYSLKGANPNAANEINIVSAKPYYKLDNNWYYSKTR